MLATSTPLIRRLLDLGLSRVAPSLLTPAHSGNRNEGSSEFVEEDGGDELGEPIEERLVFHSFFFA